MIDHNATPKAVGYFYVHPAQMISYLFNSNIIFLW